MYCLSVELIQCHIIDSVFLAEFIETLVNKPVLVVVGYTNFICRQQFAGIFFLPHEKFQKRWRGGTYQEKALF